MTEPFDIFQTENDGSVRWIGTAATLEDAKTHVQKLSLHAYGEYLVLDHRSGSKVVIRVDWMDQQATA